MADPPADPFDAVAELFDPSRADIIDAYFHFQPSEAAAGLFLALFVLAALWSARAAYKRGALFMVWVPLTCTMEAIGYAARIFMLHDPLLSRFMCMSVCLVAAPTLLALTDYLLVQKVMQVTNVTLPWPSPKAVTRAFLASDVLCLALQAAGAAVICQEGGDDLGRRLLLAGLGMQLGFFCIFVCTALAVHVAIVRQAPGPGAPQPAHKSIQKLLAILMLTVAALAMRNVYRFVEFAMGAESYLAVTEPLFLIFDPVLILGVVAALTMPCWHPGQLLAASADAHTQKAAGGARA